MWMLNSENIHSSHVVRDLFNIAFFCSWLFLLFFFKKQIALMILDAVELGK